MLNPQRGRSTYNELFGMSKPIPIVGTTISVWRMLKLACIKLGDDELGNNYFTLSQLDRLPMECQLQLANGDA